MRLATLAAAACFAASSALAADFQLPKQLVWTAYGTGSAGYNQAVAIGAALQVAAGINLRILPAGNDVARLEPLRQGKVPFSANGIGVYLAQEGVFAFAGKDWGPQKIRLLASNAGGGVAMSLGVARDACEKVGKPDCKGFTFADLKGLRVAWIKGAPALNVNSTAWLAYGGLGWDDVEKVEFGGFGAAWNGLVEGTVDAAFSATNAGNCYEAAAGPRGLFWPPFDPTDEAAFRRLLTVAPYYIKVHATVGATIDGTEGRDMAAFAYPILIGLDSTAPDLAYNMTKAMFELLPMYSGKAPGIDGWGLQFQKFDWVIPYQKGAVRYYKEAGVWSDEAQAHNDRLIARQDALAKAWAALRAENPQDWEAAWKQKRREALKAGGFDTAF
ncbi:TRAP transporter solute receptor, TAXI family [Tistlia consotensis]|uniref:TRAP transporter solute receptor, TAXI family n=1 Tax=Tistlia consotensis USBA 355 TaxID=560819 RepID=A0A1Y6B4B7_9PROT|nr:TAXI family TRAP transporter solute-binding subunit [Tistlia consotensis]SME89350.1 TRAP transporter solute receptor, TAXI family [Tistlia consotensis USBA 355]SNR25897.1 TRAP transporter solute receptor, TAXI family [Tistlia consotensis]